MNKNLSDEQLDRIAQRLVADFSADDETIDAVADSPKLWWAVRSAIETEKERRASGWFALLRPRFLALGACAAAFVAVVALLAFNRGAENVLVADSKSPAATAVASPEASHPAPPISEEGPLPVPPAVDRTAPMPLRVAERKPAPRGVAERAVRPAPRVRTEAAPSSSSVAANETRTDFIALSYAGSADGGQIVRVKVPSSMMVSLGVKSSVESESELVAAEIVVGDDGLARAIRFIH